MATFRRLLLLLLLPFSLTAQDGHEFEVVRTFKELKKQMGGNPAYVLVTNERCGATPHVIARLKNLRTEFEPVPIIIWDHDGLGPLPDTPFNPISFPTLNYFEDDRRLDVIYGWQGLPAAERNFVPDFIARTIIDTSTHARTFVQPEDVFDENVPRSGSELARTLNRRPWFPFDLRYRSFENSVLVKISAFTGSDLRGASFRNARLEKVSFAGADLTSALFDGATLQNVFWGACICPDGTASSDHGFTCQNHLNLSPPDLKQKNRPIHQQNTKTTYQPFDNETPNRLTLEP